ncbi:glycosyltransferase [Bradyrhizobium jicamae]|uniref:glycosyltransferase family 2 protein n=1 Tax=Bradyrhizobium jicamae TaxID=280332 RepID=UPI001BA9AD6F|nr:glycosyltransferase [Bradyrhizobium jicamae]MBR0753812.1 glycosyltransferase [Bradyrhizobium jicamae]
MPLLSVVIPTLNRPDTLRHALATLLAQRDADCEFIVQNNGGNGEIAALAEALGDPRLKHFATPTVLPMTENWEQALAHATGDYLTFIGDDDGLLPDACSIASGLLADQRIALLSWRPYAYYWPGYYHHAFRNRLIAEIDFEFSGEPVASRDELARVYAFQAHYADLPMIYNSFVRRDVIARMQALRGRYFIGLSPDLTSGIVNAALTDSYVRLSRPLSISGFSAHSTGHTNFFASADALGSEEGRRDFGEMRCDPRLPGLDALALFLAQDMLTMKQELFPDDGGIAVNFRALGQALASEINERPETYDRTLHSIEALAAMHGFDVADLAIAARQPDRPWIDPGVRVLGRNRVQYNLDGDALGLQSIADAARVVAQLVPGSEALMLREARGQRAVLGADGLDFTRDGQGAAALSEGWSAPEDWGTWSIAKRCTLRVTMRPRPAEPRTLALACRAFVSAQNPELRVSCRVGEGAVQEVSFSTASFAGTRMLTVDPADVSADGEISITLTLNEPRSPADLGLGADTRPLGIGIERMWLAD